MNANQPFCWWMTFTKVSNPFLPSPPKWLTWPLDVCGGVGYGWFYWFSLYWKNFFPNLSAVRNFFPDIQRCKIFFSIVHHERYFFQCRIFFSQRACFFPLEISLQDIFFLKSPVTPQKSNGRPLKSTKHLVSWQILICQPFLKAFETIGDKTF